MKIEKTIPSKLKYFLMVVIFSLFLLFSLRNRRPQSSVATIVTVKTITITTTNHPSPTPSSAVVASSDDLKIRRVYANYDAYIRRQLKKTMNPKLRKLWITRDWDRKVKFFSRLFSELKHENLLSNSSKSLSIGARVGQEVEALRRVGVADAIGIDLVPCPPLVIKGDFHNQPFYNNTFDFEFSNVFDHALYPEKFVAEIERTLKPNGVCILHVALSIRGDKYSANDLFSVKPLTRLFRRSELLRVRKVDGFGLDTEVLFRKKNI